MASQLVLLTSQQMSDYIAGLDLIQGTQAYNVLNTMLLLPPASFTQAVSALAGGLITFSDIQGLPAINATLVSNLINSRLSDTDPTTLFYNYARVWVPASINVPNLTATAVGSVPVYLSARLYDFWGGVVKPAYDFTGTDQTKYKSYSQAFAAYILAANAQESLDAIQAFVLVHQALRANFPYLLQADDANCPVLQAILSLTTSGYFLEAPGGGRVPNELLDLIQSGTYRFVAPPLFKQFMETIAYPAMVSAYLQDTDQTGAPGAANLANAAVPAPLPATGAEWAFAQYRMATVYLPGAYGQVATSSDAQDLAASNEAAIVSYLDAARVALLAVKDAVTINFPTNASAQATSGSSVGLLLTITNP